jgi:streptogramin lyase
MAIQLTAVREWVRAHVVLLAVVVALVGGGVTVLATRGGGGTKVALRSQRATTSTAQGDHSSGTDAADASSTTTAPGLSAGVPSTRPSSPRSTSSTAKAQRPTSVPTLPGTPTTRPGSTPLSPVPPPPPRPISTVAFPSGSNPGYLAVGADHNLWVAETGTSRIGRLTPGGQLTGFALPSDKSYPNDIVSGSDGAMWCLEGREQWLRTSMS